MEGLTSTAIATVQKWSIQELCTKAEGSKSGTKAENASDHEALLAIHELKMFSIVIKRIASSLKTPDSIGIRGLDWK